MITINWKAVDRRVDSLVAMAGRATGKLVVWAGVAAVAVAVLRILCGQ